MSQTKLSFRWVKNWYLLTKRSNALLGSQWAGGAILVVFAILALVLANLEATKGMYHHILESRLSFDFNGHGFGMSVEQWISDGLMAIFFFVVGLEIKRELMAGQLSSFKHAALPIAAAIGGMIVPALIYMSFNHGTETAAGWGIPMATDIAFAIGVLSLLGRRVPVSLKVFLTALAIVDDLGAIIVIAIFYTSTINFVMLGAGIVLLLLMFLMNKRGVHSVTLYLIPGLAVWYLFLYSGVHSTIAGVLVAMTIPTIPRFSKKYFSYKVRYFLEEFRFRDREGAEVLSNPAQAEALYHTREVARNAVSPAQRLEHALQPLVTFFIMPVFALANAGVDLASASVVDDVFRTDMGHGIFFGLVLGKPLGIMLMCWLAIKSGLAAMPKNATWISLGSVACLGGIGFTMSIFIDTLAFAGSEFMDAGKIAILVSSLSAAVLGAIVVNLVSKKACVSSDECDAGGEE